MFGSWVRVLPLLLIAVACAQPRPSETGSDRLVAAIESDSIATTIALLTEGVSANSPSSDGELPLNIAARLGSDTAVAELLYSGADPTRRDGLGYSSYDMAIRLDDRVVMDRLVVAAVKAAGGGAAVMRWMAGVRGEAVADLPEWHQVLNGELLSLGMMYLALHGRHDLVGQLRRAREIPNRTGYHAIAVAARWGDARVMASLLAIDVHPGVRADGPDLFSPVELARLGGHDGIVNRLIRAGARTSD